jgi:hypothetical protein
MSDFIGEFEKIIHEKNARIEALEAALRLIEPLVTGNRKACIIIRGALDKDDGK